MDDDERRQRAPVNRSSAEQSRDPRRLKPGAYSLADLQGTPHAIAPGTIGKRTLTDGLAMPEGSGAPLRPDVRSLFEQSVGADLGGVRIHDDDAAASSATAIGARAYTVGQNIYFGSGQYNAGGDPLLAHEVAHTVQQRDSAPAVQTKLEVSTPDDPLEQEADRVAPMMMRGSPVSLTAGGASAARKAWRWQTATGVPHQEHEISRDGFQIQGTNIQVERVWFEQQYQNHRVDENHRILAALERGEMPWARDLSDAERNDAANHIRLDVRFDEGQDLATVPIRNTVLIWVGLPPGTNAMWDFPAAHRDPHAAVGSPLPREATLFIRTSEFHAGAADGRQFSVALTREIVDRLEAAVGAVLLPGIRDQVIRDGQLLPPTARPTTRSVAIRHSREQMISLFGEGAWAAYEQRSNAEGAVATGSSQTGGVTVDPGISQSDSDFVRRMLDEINGSGGHAASGPSLRVTAQLVSVLREIDAHAKRAEIIAALHGGSGTSPSTDEDAAARFRRVMYAVDLREEQARLGVTGQAESRQRPFPWPVEGHIVNHTDLLFTGKTAEFSVDVTSTQQQPLMVVVPWVNVTWIVRQTPNPNTSAREIDRGHTRHQHRLDRPAHYNLSFDQTGIYEVNALVDHDDFLPNHFTISVEVKTEDERFRELEGRTYNSGMWGEVDPDSIERNHQFSGTSITDSHDHGVRYEGAMPTTCEPGTPLPGDQLRQQIANARAFMASGRATPDEIRWASEYLERMQATQHSVDQELAGHAHQLYVQGVYLARSGDGASQALALNALARRENGLWHVSIYDTTQAFDARNSHFSESAETFRSAAELAFTELCKSYPRGQMSLRVEILDDNGAATGRFIGFELDCDSTWEAVRRTVWNPTVQVVVNIAGAAVAVFLPFTAPFIVPTLIAYNAVETVANMVDLGARDALTWEDVAIGIGQIAMDVIPYIGQATKLVRVGSTVYHLFEGLQLAGEAVLMSAQMVDQVQTIRMSTMRQAAELHAQIQSLEQTNPSDPSLPGLRQQFEDVRQQAAHAWEDTITTTAGQYAVMRASMHVVHGLHEHQQHLDATARDAIGEALQTRGRQPIHADDIPHLERVMGVRVETTGVRGDVMIQYDVGALGGITNVRIVVGPEANLHMLMAHEPTLRAMQRYAGVTGSLNTLLERLAAYRNGGGRIPPGSRAFEAQFELQKLPPIIESMRAELTGHPIGSQTRERIESQIAALEQQLEQHSQALNDLTPGLGYVAARDVDPAADPNARMGEAPPTAGGPHPSGTSPQHLGAQAWPVPSDRTPAAHAQLVRERGSATVPHGGTVPPRWTGANEAHFRYGEVAREIPDGYHWTTDASGAPAVVRDREIGPDGQAVPRRYYSETPVPEGGGTTHYPLLGDDVVRARFVAGTDGVATHEHTLSADAQRAQAATIHARDQAIQARNTADQSLHALTQELHLSEDDLSSDRFPQTLDRLRREHAGDPQALSHIAELERQRTQLATQRDAVVAASERLGNQMAVDYMGTSYPQAQRIYGDPVGRGRPGEFDFIYFIPGEPPGRGTVIVVEAKGGSSSLGTRRTSAGEAQQGTRPYMDSIARAMQPHADTPELARALDGMLNPGDADAPVVRYLLVEAPLDSSGASRPGRVREFDISQ